MKAALVSLAGAIVIALQASTFYYVREVEHRLTALEITIAFLQARPAPRAER